VGDRKVTINVIKIGGSLSKNPKTLQALCQKISVLASKHQIVVVPGGGKFADNVREADKQFSLSKATAHHMAILAMDQYGLLLADLIRPNSQTVDSIEEAKNVNTGLVAIFLPSKSIPLIEEKELPKSWEVTSDSIAAYIAKKFETKNLILIKNVDGIFTDNPKQNTQAKLVEHITIKELSEMKNKTCIDTYLPKLFKNHKINCQIINGLYPDRVETALNKQKTLSTTINSP
jgi:aspartokinase-like uncharacterized kinase